MAGKLQPHDANKDKGPPFDLNGNVLTIRVDSEQAFLADFEDNFSFLMRSECRHVTCDFGRCEGLGDDAFRMVALNMFEIGNQGKDITIRIPDNLERLFRHANLYRVAIIEVVKILGRAPKEEPKPEEKHEDKPAEPAPAAKPATPASAEAVKAANAADLKTALRERYQQVERARESVTPGAAPLNPVTPVPMSPIPGTSVPPGLAAAAAQVMDGANEPRGRGRFVNRRTGQIVEINKNPTHIGRVPGNDILIAMPLVSKRHARIVLENSAYLIEDMNSANGTYVNGVRITAKTELNDGARVQIAITSQYPNGAKEYTFKQDPA